ncbi:MAG: hypothetical protein NVSMB62_08930 [Acidobacteriaceae bacterium]
MPSPNDAWHQDISSATIDPNSATIVSAAQDLGGAYLHPDFSTPADGGYGIPYIVIDSAATATPTVTYSPYDVADSDNALFPLPANMPVEGSPGQCWTDSADHHAIVIDKATCVSYEVYQPNNCNGSWSSYGNVMWDLNTTEQRPYGMSSVDAAGLSVFEGLLRYDEIAAGAINHAIRFTAMHTKQDSANGYFTAPAVHAAGNLYGTDNIMGMRIRLKAGFDISKFSTTNQIILNAMKKYGMILADNGSNMFFQGTPDARWNDTDLSALKGISATNFEVVKIGAVYDANNAPKGPAPVINSFTASSSTVASGGSVTLTPNVTGASYVFIDKVGFAGGPVKVSPSATTTYTLTARNSYGSTTASTTVTVSSSGTSTLSFTAIPNQVYGASPFAVTASSSSNGAVTYSVGSGPATISGNVVTITGVGTVTLNATQAATSSYGAATATTSFNVTGATPSINFAPISSKATGAAPFAVSATSNSQGAISYSVVSGPASISGNMVTVTGAGTVTLMASQAANGNYTTGTATTSFTVSSGTTTTNLNLSPIAQQTQGGGSIVVTATSNSPAAIGYSIVSGPATISGNQLSTNGVGTVVVQASQAATGSYSAATASTSFNVVAAPTSTPSPNTVTTKLSVSTIRTKSGYTLVANSNSPAAVDYSLVSGPATLSGNRVYVTGRGTVTVTATQAAVTGYTAASVSISFGTN